MQQTLKLSSDNRKIRKKNLLGFIPRCYFCLIYLSYSHFPLICSSANKSNIVFFYCCSGIFSLSRRIWIYQWHNLEYDAWKKFLYSLWLQRKMLTSLRWRVCIILSFCFVFADNKKITFRKKIAMLCLYLYWWQYCHFQKLSIKPCAGSTTQNSLRANISYLGNLRAKMCLPVQICADISTHNMNAQIWALRALLNVSVAHIWPAAHICQSVIRHKADEFDFNVIKRSFDCSVIGELSKIHKKLIINELIDAITDVARSLIKMYTCVPQVAFFQSANLSVIILFNK